MDKAERKADDPRFPGVTYRQGASGGTEPVVSGTGIRVQALVIAHRDWRMTVPEVAIDYDLTEEQVTEALAFYEAHRKDIDAEIAYEQQRELGKGEKNPP